MTEVVESVHHKLGFSETVERVAFEAASEAPDAADDKTAKAMQKSERTPGLTATQRADCHYQDILVSHAKHLATIVEEKHRCSNDLRVVFTFVGIIGSAVNIAFGWPKRLSKSGMPV